MTSAQFFQIQSILITSLLMFGILKHKKRQLHVPVMYTVIVLDVLLILQIEFSRSAISKASKAVSNPLLLNIHVSIALLTVIFYFILMYTGRKLLRGENAIRGKHKFLGYTALILRLLTLGTSFFAVIPKE